MLTVRPVMFICGWLLLVLAGAMIFPALVDLGARNPDWAVFVLSAAVTAFIGGAMVLATRTSRMPPLTRRQGFLLTTLAPFRCCSTAAGSDSRTPSSRRCQGSRRPAPR